MKQDYFGPSDYTSPNDMESFTMTLLELHIIVELAKQEGEFIFKHEDNQYLAPKRTRSKNKGRRININYRNIVRNPAKDSRLFYR